MSDKIEVGQVWEWESGNQSIRLEIERFNGDAVYYRYWVTTLAMSTPARLAVQLRMDGAKLKDDGFAQTDSFARLLAERDSSLAEKDFKHGHWLFTTGPNAETAVTYLITRGLVERHESNESWWRFLPPAQEDDRNG